MGVVGGVGAVREGVGDGGALSSCGVVDITGPVGHHVHGPIDLAHVVVVGVGTRSWFLVLGSLLGRDRTAEGVEGVGGEDAGFADGVLGQAVDADGDRGVGGVGVCRDLRGCLVGAVNEGLADRLIPKYVLGYLFLVLGSSFFVGA